MSEVTSRGQPRYAGKPRDFSNNNSDLRLREMIHFIADRCEDDPSCGATKLNKLLFFSDKYSYLLYGEPVSGCDYQKLEHGPAPKRLLPVKNDMLRVGEISESKKKTIHGFMQRVHSLVDCEFKHLTARDIDLMGKVCDAARDHNGTALSNLTHEDAIWKLLDEGETYPYESLFISNEALSEAHIALVCEHFNPSEGW